jgi:hypothetical protein
MRRAGRWVSPVAGLVMIMVGGYVAYYGWWEIRVLAGTATEDRVVGGAARLQSWLAGGITALGPAGLLAVLLALVAVGLVGQRRRRSRRVSAAREIPRG